MVFTWFALILGMALLSGRLFSPVSLLLFLAIPSSVALSDMGTVAETDPRLLVCVFYAAFAGVAYSMQGGRRIDLKAVVGSRQWPGNGVAVGVCLLTALHFILGGIPILGSNVEVARFDFNSGLFGIPGRASLIALPIIAGVQIIRPAEFGRAIIVLTWSVLIASRIFMGFKGGVVEIVILVAVAYLAAGRRFTVGRAAGLALAGAAGLVFAAWSAARYRTLAGQDFFGNYLMDRLGRQAAEPGWVSLRLTEFSAHLGGWFVNDLIVLGGRYLGATSPYQFAADERVSAIVTGTPLSSDSFLVPVTLGGPAYVWGSVPQGVWVWPSFLVAVVLIGMLFGRAVRICRETDRSMPAILMATAAIVAIKDFCLNGGGAYLLINYTLVIGLISIASLMVKTKKQVQFKTTRQRFDAMASH